MRTHKIEHAPMVRLGELIELCDERNSEGKYGIDDVRGISTEKKFIETKANLDGVSLTSYKIVMPDEFVYVADTSRRGEKIALALNDTNSGFLISSIYTTFRSKDENILLPEYLYLLLSRTEFDRYSRFNSWGSARETFDWSEMCRVQIPLPSIETQKELVAVYNGLKELAEENEKLLEPLEESCQAFIVDCKKKYPMKKLGDYIIENREKNTEGVYSKVMGLSTQKQFREPNSRVNKDELHGYKITENNSFAFVPTTDTWKVFACALNKGETIVVSPIYCVFKLVNEETFLADFLSIYFKRKEFDRYVRFNSWGSARENFNFDDLCDVKIPVPPLEIQQKIVNLFNCYEECKRISTTAREKIKNLCPALVQKAAHSE
ncbi:restriction endonuclease subunit S [uncultured Treponema sp.]|uniref:restriction endonuclease subunit S n=1 Tax=uncultured Treponema sp. TaxID=162155 RepID=UPI002593384F|nr:restriction endonuclease subunit S [uncultured Treponema sp.]